LKPIDLAAEPFCLRAALERCIAAPEPHRELVHDRRAISNDSDPTCR
jgi:hypothetical protein